MTVYTRACPQRLSPLNRLRDWWRMRHPRGSRRADRAASAAGSAAGRENRCARCRAALRTPGCFRHCPASTGRADSKSPQCRCRSLRCAESGFCRMAHHSGYAGGLSGCAVEQDGLLPDAPVQRQKQQAGMPVLAAVGGLSDTEQEHCHLRASPEP